MRARSKLRLGILVGLLGLSLVALAYRSEIQVWLRGVGDGVAALVGRAAPVVPGRLKTLDGRPLRTAKLRGHVVLLHFWTYG